MKRLAIFVVLLMLLGACTTQRSDAPTEVAAAPDEAVTTTIADAGTPIQSVDQPTTTEAPPATLAATTTAAPSPTPPATTPTTAPPAPGPALIDPAYAPSITVVMLSPDTGPGPITINIGSTETSVDVTLEAEATPFALANAFRWRVNGGPADWTLFVNPAQNDFTLTLPGGQSSAVFTITAEAWDTLAPGGLGIGSIEIAVIQDS